MQTVSTSLKHTENTSFKFGTLDLSPSPHRTCKRDPKDRGEPTPRRHSNIQKFLPRQGTAIQGRPNSQIVELSAQQHCRSRVQDMREQGNTQPPSSSLTSKLQGDDLTVAAVLRFAGWKLRNKVTMQGEQDLPDSAITKIACLEAIGHLKALALKHPNPNDPAAQSKRSMIAKLKTIHDNA
eukprot:TRINITY_DN14087_c0_g1_i1.p1 TRINITY_DN14087_c0_g1~~TRINITY_DN14087_c0_g1_i1.p1  ORF type:complete len:181 (-),score=10.88 TRINITY_DN14087_c0_g1_i1:123-665(-)